MKRKQFIQSTALSLGALSISPIATACNARQGSKKIDSNLNPKIIKKGEGEKQIVLGDNQTLKLTGKDTDELYLMYLMNLCYPFHRLICRPQQSCPQRSWNVQRCYCHNVKCVRTKLVVRGILPTGVLLGTDEGNRRSVMEFIPHTHKHNG